MSRAWGNGASIGSLVVFSDEMDLQRIGNCWMNGRVKIGDVAMPIGRSGDCFYNYILIEVGGNFITGIPGSRFGAYFFGLPIESWKPDDREFQLLCAGESIIFPADIHKCKVPFISELNKIKEAALKTGGQTSCNKRLPGSQPKSKNKNGVISAVRPKSAKRGLRVA